MRFFLTVFLFPVALIVCSGLVFSSEAYAQSDELVALDFRRQGLACQEQGDFKKALHYYERAAILSPGEPAIYNDIGLMNEYIGNKKEAEDGYRKAISVDSKYLPAYGNLGMLYAKVQQYALAVRYLRERVNRGRADDPWTLKAQEALETIYSKVPELKADRIHEEADHLAKDVAASRDRIKRKAEKDRSVGFEMTYEKGLQSLEQKDYDQAIDLLETAVALDPRQPGAVHALKRARYEKERLLLDAQATRLQKESQNRNVTQTLEAMSAH